MKLGIIGVGHLATSILKGLLRAGIAAQDITLSPRGAAARLSAEHGFVLAADNTEVVQRSTAVLLSVRPTDAMAALQDMPWRAEHVVMSACAGVTISSLSTAATPARVVRIMPITAAEQGASPTLVYPHDPRIQPFLDAIGSSIAVTTEDQFEAATVQAAVYGWAQALICTGANWGAAQGLDPSVSRQLAARTFVAAGLMQTDETQTMEATLAKLCTPGGITEAGLDVLQTAAVPTAWENACTLVLHRLRGPKE
ncbi:MAG: pyrroline-5-carboxylate reductase family protein [Roseobacter sp.]